MRTWRRFTALLSADFQSAGVTYQVEADGYLVITPVS
jgi:hypothetical protein